MSFIPFAKLSVSQQEAAIQDRPTLHIEPVMVHSAGAAARGATPMGIYHLQLGDIHTVLRADELAIFLRQIEHASRQLRDWGAA